MMTDLRFDEDTVRKIESILLDHDIARSYFHGELYDRLGNTFSGFSLELQSGRMVELDAKKSAYLFMIPDGSTVWVRRVNEHGNAPAGMNIHFTNSFVVEGEESSVIAFSADTTPGVWNDALHINRMMLRADAPARLGTVGFGMMAVTAYRLGFTQIQLYAAGRTTAPRRSGRSDRILRLAEMGLRCSCERCRNEQASNVVDA